MAPTQAALYRELSDDLHLSWSERELPERERTKHVHRLHPYLGKFVPQLVEALLGRYVRAGGRVLDPFAGSGTTLVQCLESGYDAVGIDVAAFNCLLMRVKTARYDLQRLEADLRHALGRAGRSRRRPRGYVEEWFARPAAAELLHFRSLVDEYEHGDVLGSSSPVPRGRRGSRRISTSSSRVCRSATPIGATSIGANVPPSRRPKVPQPIPPRHAGSDR
jgi:hypothetical protein